MGKLTVAQLNFWLKCLSINQNGSKMELLDRCTSSSFARSISSLCCFFFYYKCTWRFRHVFSYITSFLRVKNVLTQRGASLKQSQRDNEELREMGKREWCSKPVRELSHLWFSIWWLLCRPFHVRSDWYIRTSKVLWKEHQSTDVGAKFASSKGLRMLSLLVDDVIYYRKSDKYIIS